MAESQRQSTQVDAAIDDEAQNKRDRMTRIMFLVGGIVIVACMVLLSKFLSNS